MDYRCIHCGTRAHVIVNRIACDDDIVCEHCHERDCNECPARYEYMTECACDICGATADYAVPASEFVQCSLCLNMYHASTQTCPYCSNKQEIARLLHSTFPYQNDIQKKIKRQAIFEYIRLRGN